MSPTPADWTFADPIGEAPSWLADAAQQGQCFFGGVVGLAVGVGSVLRFLLSNPVGSGKNVYLYQLQGFATVGPAYSTLVADPTGNKPVTVVTPANNLIGAAPGVAQLAIDAGSAMTGGTPLGGAGVAFPAAAPRDLTLPCPLVIPPGHAVGSNTPGILSLSKSVAAFWWEA